jgi:hypothetical protein
VEITPWWPRPPPQRRADLAASLEFARAHLR